MKFLLLSTLFLSLAAQAQNTTMGSNVPSGEPGVAAPGTATAPTNSGASDSTLNSSTYSAPMGASAPTTQNTGVVTQPSNPTATGATTSDATFDGTNSSLPGNTDTNANIEASGVNNGDLNSAPTPVPSNSNTSDTFGRSTVGEGQDTQSPDVYSAPADAIESDETEMQAEEFPGGVTEDIDSYDGADIDDNNESTLDQ